MAFNRPVYQAPSNPAYAGNLASLAHALDRGTDTLFHSPGMKQDVGRRLITWAEFHGIDLVALAAETLNIDVVANGEVITPVTVTGTGTTATFTVVNDKITAIALA